MSIKVNLISLGCSKNLVDSEKMLASLIEAGIEIVEDASVSDVAIVNTCGFIDAAKKEAIENILEMVKYKEDGAIKGIVVTGCLTERYQGEFSEELPEVNAVLGTGSYDKIVSAVKAAYSNQKMEAFDDIEKISVDGNRVVSTPKYSAFIKISEGCNNRCSFCIIPALRGKYRSRTIENIVEEAKNLAENGTKELIVIAQDVTRYGNDIYGDYKLVDLLKELSKIEGLKWIRLHYLYPELLTDDLISYMIENPKIVNYFDIPMQHINDRILKLMRRRGGREYLSKLVRKIREKDPEAVIRTSLIVGLPSETEEEFVELCEFVEEAKMQRAGVFSYSREEGTEAYSMENQVDEDTKNRRKYILEEIQSRVMDSYNDSQISKTLEVLCEGFDEEYAMYFGRTFADSQDIDGRVYFDSEIQIEEGDFVLVKITETFDPFLKGILVD